MTFEYTPYSFLAYSSSRMWYGDLTVPDERSWSLRWRKVVTKLWDDLYRSNKIVLPRDHAKMRICPPVNGGKRWASSVRVLRSTTIRLHRAANATSRAWPWLPCSLNFIRGFESSLSQNLLGELQTPIPILWLSPFSNAQKLKAHKKPSVKDRLNL